MIKEDHEKAFVDGMRRMLEECETATDARIRMRLKRARLMAIEAADEQIPWYLRFPRLMTAGTLATAAIIGVSLWIMAERGGLPNGQVEDLEIITSHEQIDMYKDLDFYRWLENSDHAG